MEPYAGRNAVVTGAGSGIGEALAKQLGARGARVFVADIDAEAARRVARSIADEGGRAEAATVDVRDPEQLRTLTDRVVSDHGTLDYMFNNAGIAIVAEALHMGLEDWNRIIDVNLRGVIHGIHAAYPIMVRQKSGHIVNTASVAGLMPAAALSGYAATKHAVVGISTSLRMEAERYGVNVSVICPGLIDTPIQENADIHGIQREIIEEQIPFAAYPPDACAQDALRGVARNEGTIVITSHGKALTSFRRYAPRLFDWVVGRQFRKVLVPATVPSE